MKRFLKLRLLTKGINIIYCGQPSIDANGANID